jgi:6-pyruvoyltetrahydropterin/6-carboxytetrahydropterin synthase
MRIQRSFRAEMAHKVPGAYTCRCHHLHGHSYRFEVEAQASTADQAHMVIDFKLLEACGIKDFLDGFDHCVVLSLDDDLAPLIDRVNPDRHLLVPFLPTAEMIAKACFKICSEILKGHNPERGEAAVITAVRVFETDRGAAEYRIEDQATDNFPAVDLSRWVISEEIRAAWQQHPALARILPQA